MAELCIRDEEVLEDGEDSTDKGYNAQYLVVVVKKGPGYYLWGSNMDMDIKYQVCRVNEGIDRSERVEKMDLDSVGQADSS